MSQQINHSSYNNEVYENPKEFAKIVKWVTATVKLLRRRKPFQAIAFSGTSGAALAYPLSAALELPVICVRKPNENSHGQNVEGPRLSLESYIIVDDFISSGSTVTHIMKSLAGATPAAIVLYTGTKKYRNTWQDQMNKEGQPGRGELHPETPIYRV